MTNEDQIASPLTVPGHVEVFRNGVPTDIGGYFMAEALWSHCLPLVDKLNAIMVHAYCPVVRERRRSERRGSTEIRTPAFGGYLWIANQAAVTIPDRLADRFRPFFHDGFVWFSEDEIERIRDLEADWPVVRADANRTRLSKGTRIKVVAGPFQGRRGQVQHDSGARVKVSLGGWVVDLPPFMVEPEA